MSTGEFFDAHGWGVWALELPGEATFAGFVGLTRRDFPADTGRQPDAPSRALPVVPHNLAAAT